MMVVMFQRRGSLGVLGGELAPQAVASSFYKTWQLRDYGKLFSIQLITAMMMIYRRILMRKVDTAKIVQWICTDAGT